MKKVRYGQLGFVMWSALCASAQTPAPPSSLAINPSLTQATVEQAVHSTNSSLVLSNSAVLVISKARGVEAAAVKLKFSDAMSGRFEVNSEGISDLRRDAEMLSTAFGTNFAVIVDQATADGRLRTNYVFRGGSARKTVAPIVNQALPPGGQRLYVWPQTSRLTAPVNVRLVQQEN